MRQCLEILDLSEEIDFEANVARLAYMCQMNVMKGFDEGRLELYQNDEVTATASIVMEVLHDWSDKMALNMVATHTGSPDAW